MKNSLVVIVGPTASGKSNLALRLAGLIDGEIVSADSRQIYRGMDIGTAKPTKTEQAGIPHHFVDILDPDEEYSAGTYGKDARKVIEDIRKRGKTPVMVGGSGLYLRAAIDGLFDGPGKDPELRGRLEEEEARVGIDGLLKTLEAVDPATAAAMKGEPAKRRIIRALEVYYSTGQPLSRFHAEQRRESLPITRYLGLSWERGTLYNRIGQRVDEMIGKGLVEEARRLRETYDPAINALNTVGYKELMDYLGGRCSLEEAVNSIKLHTRRFAKRQLTWFKADRRIQWITVSDEEELEGIAQTLARESKEENAKRR